MATMYIRNARDIFIVSFMTLALSGCERPDSANSKIAYVDVAKAISDSSIGLQEESRNLKVRNILLKAEAGANEKYKMMSEKQKQQSRDIDNLTLNQVWIAEQQRSRDLSIKAIAEEAELYRSTHNMDFIVVNTSVLAAKESNNITGDLIKQLKNKTVNYGELPKINVSENTFSNDKIPEDVSKSNEDMNITR